MTDEQLTTWLGVSCPTCNAKPDEPCTGALTGEPLHGEPHGQRYAAWLKAVRRDDTE